MMPPAPPKIAETVVGFLLPPASREHVLGDLQERYTSPLQYILDAAYTVPLVIVSRIRRTVDPQVLLMQAFALYISFLAAAWYIDPRFLLDSWGPSRLAIPSAIALLALILAGAYDNPKKPSPVQPILQTALAIGFMFLSQAVLSVGAREIAGPSWILLGGGSMSLLLVSTLRMLFPPVASGSSEASAGEPARVSPELIRIGKGAAAIVAVAIFAACLVLVAYQLRK